MNMIPFPRRDAPTPGPDCARFADLLPVLDEPAADAAQTARAREHLRGCAYCQGQVAEYDRIDAALSRQFGYAATPRLATENIMADIEEPVHPVFYSSASDHSTTTVTGATATTGVRPPRRRRGKLSAFASVAAVLLIAVLAAVIYGTHTRKPTSAPISKATQTSGLPVPRGSQTMMQSISMDSATDGWAVGRVAPSGDGTKPTFMHYTGGKWQSVDVGFSADIESVSMVSASDGWAAGVSGLAHYDGKSWQLMSPATHGSFNAIQMLSATDGWAVGHEDFGNLDNYVLNAIMHYDGSSWTPQPLPVIPGVTNTYFVELLGLDMLSPTNGWAVGQAQANDFNPSPATPNVHTPAPTDAAIILHYTGGKWVLADEIPSAQLQHIAMGSATDGWATGSTESWATSTSGPIGSSTPLLLRYQNGAWTAVSEPESAGVTLASSVQTVMALSPTDVWFAGQHGPVDTNSTSISFAMAHYNGAKFTAQSLTLSRRFDVNITGISMLSPTEGWAVGDALWPRDDGVPSGTGHGFTPTITPLFLVCHGGVWNVVQD